MVTSSLWQGSIFLVYVEAVFIPSAVSFAYFPASRVDDAKCLGVFTKLGHSWVLACTASLSLTPEELLEWILWNLFTKEHFNTRYLESKPCQLSPTSDLYSQERFLAEESLPLATAENVMLIWPSTFTHHALLPLDVSLWQNCMELEMAFVCACHY